MSKKGMRAITLGTGGGPIVSATRAGTSTAICIDDATYIVDCGMGSIRHYRQHCGLESLRGIFLTHHHSDHIYDLGSYLLTGWQVPGESFEHEIQIYAPAKPEQIPALNEVHLAEISCCVGARQRAAVMAMVTGIASLGGVIAPIMVGHLMQGAGYTPEVMPGSLEAKVALETGMNKAFWFIGMYLMALGALSFMYLNPEGLLQRLHAKYKK